eukprot:TRINITY_DN2333_c0_g1_i1.p1 TRINITY_DN2333_c0_g1~~TRINITY_DN2333_c0_g1_i1.p1  ORF type:complete len:90 (+),score=28.80 TRINITY_DN2333_c0_g1_i1:116-385(+)
MKINGDDSKLDAVTVEALRKRPSEDDPNGSDQSPPELKKKQMLEMKTERKSRLSSGRQDNPHQGKNLELENAPDSLVKKKKVPTAWPLV